MGKTVDCNFKALEDSVLKNLSMEEYDCYIKELRKELERVELQKKILQNFIANFEKKPELRKGFMESNEVNDNNLDLMIRYVPPCARDPSDVKLGKHQKNTGIFLWCNGYNPIEFLGKGANGVIWKCTKKDGKEFVAKVTCNQKFGPFKVDAVKSELDIIEKLNEIKKSEDEFEKYFLPYKKSGKSGTDSRVIIKTSLADEGDLNGYVKKPGSKVSLLKIINMFTQCAMGVEILHRKGYSHNDIKPENLFVLKKVSGKVTNNESKGSGSRSSADSKISEDGSEVDLKIADFGAMTKIDDTKKVFANKHFCAPDCYKLSEEAVGKRDVYSLGLCALYFLFGGKSASYHKIAKDLTVKYKDNIESFIIDNSLNQKYGDDIILHKFLQVIQKMVKSDHNERIDIEKAVPELKELTNPQKNIGGV